MTAIGPITPAKFTAALVSLCFVAPLSACAQERATPLDLSDYRLTFEETFRGPLDVTAHGPSKWTAHTPWNGDFGGAKFADPSPSSPFITTEKGLQIIAKRDAHGKWQSGLLSSTDSQGRGFEQVGGYFEARMKLPAGHAVWPAFWLGSRGNGKQSLEVDVIEYYGDGAQVYSSSVHIWPKTKATKHSVVSHHNTVQGANLNGDFHTYGVEIKPDFIIFYFDRVEYWRQPAPEAAKSPVMILANLALDDAAGKSYEKTPNPSILYIDYIRAYAHK